MKVCTDACLFGAYVADKIIPSGNILDIGAGTGLLTLMLAQKTDALIDAVELDKEAATQAIENVAGSPWKERIAVINRSIQDYYTNSGKKYSLIISNPPFYENYIKSPEASRNTAIHAETLSLSELIDASVSLLEKHGTLAILLPPYESSLLKTLAETKGLFLNQAVSIKDNPEGKVIREITFYSFAKSEVITSEITIKKSNESYSPAFIALLKDYYLYL